MLRVGLAGAPQASTGRGARASPNGPSSAGTCGPSAVCAGHPDRQGRHGRGGMPVAPVHVALLVAGAPAGLPVDAQRATRGHAGRRRSPRSPAASSCATAAVDQPVLRRRRVAGPGRAARGRPGPPHPRPGVGAITEQLHDGWTEDGGGGIWWRRGGGASGEECPRQRSRRDTAGPRRAGRVRGGDQRLDGRDPRRPRHRPGPRRRAGGPRTASVKEVDKRIFTYCQGVHLGACVELAVRDGHLRWGDRAVALVDAVTHRLARADGVLPGCGGGDGGLFAGILARYLADAALRRPELTDAAARIGAGQRGGGVAGGPQVRGGPVFSADWGRPALEPRNGAPRPTCRSSCPAGCCWRRRQPSNDPADPHFGARTSS